MGEARCRARPSPQPPDLVAFSGTLGPPRGLMGLKACSYDVMAMRTTINLAGDALITAQTLADFFRVQGPRQLTDLSLPVL